MRKVKKLIRKLFRKSINYIYLLAFPCIVGLVLLSRDIMMLLGGGEFIPASYSLKIDCVLVVVDSVGTWQVHQNSHTL